MKHKFTNQELQQLVLLSQPPVNFSQASLATVVSNTLEVKKESTDFLKGLTSGMLMLYKLGGLTEESSCIVSESLRQCASELITRKD